MSGRRVALGVVALLAGALLARHFLSSPEVVNPEPSGSAIICFGDSLTAGTGADDGASYPDHLARAIARPVVNAGIPGDTTASAIERLERDVLERDPRIVIITLGGNDLLGGVEAPEAFARLETIVRRIQAAGALVVVGGLAPPIQGRGYSAGYEQLCADNGCVLVADILGGIMGRRELMADQIHPNGRGYEVLAERFARAVEPYL